MGIFYDCARNVFSRVFLRDCELSRVLELAEEQARDIFAKGEHVRRMYSEHYQSPFYERI
jgi:hypothetical protein